MSKVGKLHDAIRADDVKTIKSLVQQGVDVNAIFQQETAFTWVAQCNHFNSVNIIMSSKKFSPNNGNQFDRTPLFMASKLGQPEIVRRLLDLGARVNDADIRGVTPLGSCAWYDSYECAEILIQHGANVDQPDVVGQTPLYRACSNVSKNVVRVLLDHSCDVNLPTCDRTTPLMAALPSANGLNAGKKLSDMMVICKMLLTGGCDINAQDEYGKTALHHTVENNDNHGMCFIAEHGGDLEIKDNVGHTAFHTAILPKQPRYELAVYLLHFGADGRNEMLNPNEHESPNISPLCLLLTSKPNRAMNTNEKWSRTLLLRTLCGAINPNGIKMRYHPNRNDYLARENMNIHNKIECEIVQMVNLRIPCNLQHQARLKVREVVGGRNCLAKINSLPISKIMKQDLNLGLDSNTKSLEAVCELHMAIQDGHNEIVKKLLDDGTSTEIYLRHRNALTVAIEVGNIEATMMIVRNKLPRKKLKSSIILNPSHDSALHIAAKHGRLGIVKELISLKCDVNAKNDTGGTPLQEAVFNGHFETAAILIEHGANTNVYAHGVPVLHLAAASASTEVVELLLARGCSVNADDVFGNTALHVVASKGAEYLHRNISLPALYHDQTSAAVDAINMIMTTSPPVLIKKSLSHLETLEFLLKSGANVTILNSQSKTALMNAEEAEDIDMINAIRSVQ